MVTGYTAYAYEVYVYTGDVLETVLEREALLSIDTGDDSNCTSVAMQSTNNSYETLIPLPFPPSAHFMLLYSACSDAQPVVGGSMTAPAVYAMRCFELVTIFGMFRFMHASIVRLLAGLTSTK